ncbi:hypothetical protein DUD79_30115 [Priestia aryabhattai]
MSLSGTHHQKEPVWQKDSDKGSFSGVCSFLYILYVATFFRRIINKKVYKKRTFYTYAYSCKKSLSCEKYVIISLLNTLISYLVFIKSHLSERSEVAFYFVNEINHLYGDFFCLQATVLSNEKYKNKGREIWITRYLILFVHLSFSYLFVYVSKQK